MSIQGGSSPPWLYGSNTPASTSLTGVTFLSPRVVSKVPATSPNFWHVVAKNLQLGYSAEECQQVYQGLVPSLPTAVVGKKTKKNGK